MVSDEKKISLRNRSITAKRGYNRLRFRNFVLQGDKDNYYMDEVLCGIVSEIYGRFPDCAITLSIGERSKASYQNLFDTGVSRYLLRHETPDELHYQNLHLNDMSLQKRHQCLYNLKEIGYQIGSDFMVD